MDVESCVGTALANGLSDYTVQTLDLQTRHKSMGAFSLNTTQLTFSIDYWPDWYALSGILTCLNMLSVYYKPLCCNLQNSSTGVKHRTQTIRQVQDSNTKLKVQNSKYRTQSTGLKVQTAKLQEKELLLYVTVAPAALQQPTVI